MTITRIANERDDDDADDAKGSEIDERAQLGLRLGRALELLQRRL